MLITAIIIIYIMGADEILAGLIRTGMVIPLRVTAILMCLAIIWGRHGKFPHDEVLRMALAAWAFIFLALALVIVIIPLGSKDPRYQGQHSLKIEADSVRQCGRKNAVKSRPDLDATPN